MQHGPTRPEGDRPALARLRVVPERWELVAEALFDAGASSVEERRSASGSALLLVAGFADRGRARAALAGLDPADVVDAVVEIPADTWFDGWRAHARPQRAGRRFIVTPPWCPAGAGPDDLVLCIDPGRAFGNGAHPSTRLVLAELEALVRCGATVLDLGSGSGVLSIAAVRLGAASACAVDIDPAATEATAANAARNAVDGTVRVTDRMPDGPFDLAVANIGANALITLAPTLVSRAAVVVLAGFLDERADEVAAAYAAAGSPVASRRGLEGWTALTCVRSRC